MNQEPGDARNRYFQQPSWNPVAYLPEPGDTQVRVTFSYGPEDNIKHAWATIDAAGPPHFLEYRRIEHKYVQIQIGGSRPMKLVILRNGTTVFRDMIHTQQSYMKIHFLRRDLPCRFIVRLGEGQQRVQTVLDIN